MNSAFASYALCSSACRAIAVLRGLSVGNNVVHCEFTDSASMPPTTLTNRPFPLSSSLPSRSYVNGVQATPSLALASSPPRDSSPFFISSAASLSILFLSIIESTFSVSISSDFFGSPYTVAQPQGPPPPIVYSATPCLSPASIYIHSFCSEFVHSDFHFVIVFSVVLIVFVFVCFCFFLYSFIALFCY